jgi:hypothetical protein
MQKVFKSFGNVEGDRENMGTETKGCVLDIHFGGGETHFDPHCLTVVVKKRHK